MAGLAPPLPPFRCTSPATQLCIAPIHVDLGVKPRRGDLKGRYLYMNNRGLGRCCNAQRARLRYGTVRASDAVSVAMGDFFALHEGKMIVFTGRSPHFETCNNSRVPKTKRLQQGMSTHQRGPICLPFQYKLLSAANAGKTKMSRWSWFT